MATRETGPTSRRGYDRPPTDAAWTDAWDFLVEDLDANALYDVDGEIDTHNLATSAVTREKIIGDAVGSVELDSGAVDTASLQASAVTTTNIASDAVTSNEIATDAVQTDHVGTGVITATEVADATITATQLATDSVTDDEIATNSVGDDELKDGAGGGTVIVDTTVTLSGGEATVSTGVSSGHVDVALDPSGGGNNAADVAVSARARWNDSAAEYEVEILEDGTDVGNPDVGVKVIQH